MKDRREFDKARADALKARTAKTVCHYGEDNYVPPAPPERVYFEGERRFLGDTVFVRRNDKWEFSHTIRTLEEGTPLKAPVEVEPVEEGEDEEEGPDSAPGTP